MAKKFITAAEELGEELRLSKAETIEIEFRSDVAITLVKIISHGKSTHEQIAQRAGTLRTRVIAIASGKSGVNQLAFLAASAVSLESTFQRAGDYETVYFDAGSVDWNTFQWLNIRLYRISGATGGKVYEALPLPQTFDHLIYFKTSTPIEIKQ